MAKPIDPNARFERLRAQAKQENVAQTQQQTDALKRRFASLGMLGSGASIKSEQLAAQEGAKRLESRLSDISNIQEQEQLTKQEQEQARQFAREERLGSQQFASGESALGRRFAERQAGLQRQFQTGERLGSQDFASAQAEAQRKYATGERLSAQDFAALQAGLQREFQTGERLGGQQFAGEQAGLQRQFQTEMLQNQQAFQQRENKLNRSLQSESLRQQAAQFAKNYLFEVDKFDFDKYITEENLKMARSEAAQSSLPERATNAILGKLGVSL